MIKQRQDATLLPDNLDPTILSDLNRADTRDDNKLRTLVPPNLLTFDWHNEPETFSGVREEFTGSTGVTFPMSEIQNPVDAFLKIWDVDIMEHIVSETNKYAEQDIQKQTLKKHSRFLNWTPTDRGEILTFFALLILHSLSPKPVEKDYFKSSGILSMPGLASVMTYNRFIVLKRFIHFTDIDTIPANLTSQEKSLYRIQPIIDHLRYKFSSLYFPSEYIAIDESLLHYSGRLSFVQKIVNKAAKVGVKSFELCESSTGYLWQFFIYAGKQTGKRQELTHNSDLEPDGATAKVIYDLARPLFGKGYAITIGNSYNSPLLARCLKQQKTDVLGAVRVSRKFVPDSIKTFAKSELRVGEVVSNYTTDLSVLLCRDASLICVISTYHPVEAEADERYGDWRYKPKAVLDYNLLMGGVDKKNQILSAFPIERVRNQVWFKTLFRRLLNVSILNACIMFRCKEPKITVRAFRMNLAESLLAIFKPLQPNMREVKSLATIPIGQTQRPRLTGNHFIVKGLKKRGVCVWCREFGKKTRTVYICEQCDVSLCLEYCFKNYHTK